MRTANTRDAASANVVKIGLVRIAFADLDDDGSGIRGDEEQALLGLKSRPRPIGTAAPARQLDVAAQRRWGEQWTIVKLSNNGLCFLFKSGAEVDEIVTGRARVLCGPDHKH